VLGQSLETYNVARRTSAPGLFQGTKDGGSSGGMSRPTFDTSASSNDVLSQMRAPVSDVLQANPLMTRAHSMASMPTGGGAEAGLDPESASPSGRSGQRVSLEGEDEIMRTLLDPMARLSGLNPGLQSLLRQQFVKQLGNMSTMMHENRSLRAQMLRLREHGHSEVGTGVISGSGNTGWRSASHRARSQAALAGGLKRTSKGGIGEEGRWGASWSGSGAGGTPDRKRSFDGPFRK